MNRIIFLSSQLNDYEKREQAMELGADAYIGKSFEPEELLTAIETLL